MKPNYHKDFDKEFWYCNWRWFSGRDPWVKNSRFKSSKHYRYERNFGWICRNYSIMSMKREENFLRSDEDCKWHKISCVKTEFVDPWDNEKPPTRYRGRSWKDYNRCRKQWMHKLK